MSQLNADPCYIFTDTETTGLDINFSQIIQVGSILTDENFTTEATQDIGSNLLPWVVPSPEAFLVHKKIDCLEGKLQSHYEMMIELRKAWLEWPKGRNSVFITYNGHRFDEELFRRQFYWCLLPSYITNTSGATRLDMMSTLQLVANFFPKSLQLPSFEPGEVSMKLTDWSEANNIEASNAHDALADCYLMLELAKLVESNAPQVWRASLQGASKFGNLNILQSEPFAMMGEIIRRKSFTYPVTFCGQNRRMNNEVAVADLYFDPDELNDLTDTELLEQIGNSGSAIRKVKINKSMPIMSANSIPHINQYLDIPFEQLEERARKIKNNTNLQTRVSELLTNNQVNYPPPKYVEQSVYSGFASEADQLWMERFHSLPWNERVKLLDGFEDSRYKELAERLICSNVPEHASSESMDRYSSFINQRLHDKGPWLSLEKGLEKTNKLLLDATDEKKLILEALEDNLTKKNSFI
ncbi:exonuclease domain-containing protein [Gammaproteobacteria bacterium]|nr:exonuclease domain-containing protein [Gammaproteobacteria bacterium]